MSKLRAGGVNVDATAQGEFGAVTMSQPEKVQEERWRVLRGSRPIDDVLVLTEWSMIASLSADLVQMLDVSVDDFLVCVSKE